MNHQTPNDVTSASAFTADRHGVIRHWNLAYGFYSNQKLILTGIDAQGRDMEVK